MIMVPTKDESLVKTALRKTRNSVCKTPEGVY